MGGGWPTPPLPQTHTCVLHGVGCKHTTHTEACVCLTCSRVGGPMLSCDSSLVHLQQQQQQHAGRCRDTMSACIARHSTPSRPPPSTWHVTTQAGRLVPTPPPPPPGLSDMRSPDMAHVCLHGSLKHEPLCNPQNWPSSLPPCRGIRFERQPPVPLNPETLNLSPLAPLT